MERHYLPKFGKRTPGDVTRREHVAFRELHEVKRPAEMRQMKAYISAFYKWMAQTSDYMDLVEGAPNMGTAVLVSVDAPDMKWLEAD
jgi:hypothetical protein